MTPVNANATRGGAGGNDLDNMSEGVGQHGFFLNFQTGQGNTQTPSYSASSVKSLPWYVWAAIIAGGVILALILRKKGGRK